MNTTQPQVTVKQTQQNGRMIYLVKRLVNYTNLSIGQTLTTDDLDRLMAKWVNVIIN